MIRTITYAMITGFSFLVLWPYLLQAQNSDTLIKGGRSKELTHVYLANLSLQKTIDTGATISLKTRVYGANRSAELCRYSRIKIKRNKRITLVDDELPINTLEIPNTSKSRGSYELKGTLLIVSIISIKTREVTINRKSWLRKVLMWKTVKQKLESPSVRYYSVRNNGIEIWSYECCFKRSTFLNRDIAN